MRNLLIIALTILTTACTSEGNAYKECTFEYTKIIAIKGQSLDHDETWNRVLKRQFFTDCMDAEGYELSEQRINNLK